MSGLYESDDKMVSHPSHYKSKNGLETIEVVEAFTANLSGIEAFDTGNILKYACRWKEKNGKQDIKKIIWYASHLLKHLEEEEERIDKKATEIADAITSSWSTKYDEDTKTTYIRQWF